MKKLIDGTNDLSSNEAPVIGVFGVIWGEIALIAGYLLLLNKYVI